MCDSDRQVMTSFVVCALNRDTCHAALRLSCGVMVVVNGSPILSRVAKM